MKNQIKRIYTRRYRDSGQVVAYVDWADGSRSEGTAHAYVHPKRQHIGVFSFGSHMHALFARAKREGLKLQRETWGGL